MRLTHKRCTWLPSDYPLAIWLHSHGWRSMSHSLPESIWPGTVKSRLDFNLKFRKICKRRINFLDWTSCYQTATSHQLLWIVLDSRISNDALCNPVCYMNLAESLDSRLLLLARRRWSNSQSEKDMEFGLQIAMQTLHFFKEALLKTM